ncbi:uncharacterized protein PSFLO_06988 [Pseudozyma flocculosa]|nr:uncharacterized protein PSFLO_06988 [Pseudozyma flocculosa]
MFCPSSPPAPSSAFHHSPNARRRLSGQSFIGYSPTPTFGSLIGSYEESLLRGRMSMPASKPLTFDAELGVLGLGKCRPALRCPPHLNLQFPAHFYDLKQSSALNAPDTDASSALGSPYVGTVDLESHYYAQLLPHGTGAQQAADAAAPWSVGVADPAAAAGDLASFPGYRIPPKGQIQLVIKNQNLTAVKLFLVPYDLTDMPAGTKTFIRQKSMVVVPLPGTEATPAAAGPRTPSHIPSRDSPAPTPTTLASSQTSKPPATPKDKLRYAVHLQFCSPPVPPPKQRKADPGFEGRDRIGELGPAQKASDTSKPAPQPKIYLHKSIRVVFAARTPDKSEKLNVVTETPGTGEQRYTSYAGPSDEWKQALRSARASAKRAQSEAARSHSDVHARHLGLGLGLGGGEQDGRPTEGDAVAQDYAAMPTDIPPYEPNSDPNGERWEGPSSFSTDVDGVAIVRPVSRAETAEALAASSLASPWPSSASSSSGFDARIAQSTAVAVDSPSTVVADDAPIRRFAHPNRRPAPLETRSRSGTPTSARAPGMARRSSAVSNSSVSTTSTSGSGARARAPLSSPTSTTSTASSEDDQALLDAWHQTWRRLPSVHGGFRPASPVSGRSTPTASRPLSPAYERHLTLSAASTAAAAAAAATGATAATATATTALPATAATSLGLRAASPIARMRSPPISELAGPQLQSISVQADSDVDHEAGASGRRPTSSGGGGSGSAVATNATTARPTLLRKLSEQFAGQLHLGPHSQAQREVSRLRQEVALNGAADGTDAGSSTGGGHATSNDDAAIR